MRGATTLRLDRILARRSVRLLRVVVMAGRRRERIVFRIAVRVGRWLGRRGRVIGHGELARCVTAVARQGRLVSVIANRACVCSGIVAAGGVSSVQSGYRRFRAGTRRARRVRSVAPRSARSRSAQIRRCIDVAHDAGIVDVEQPDRRAGEQRAGARVAVERGGASKWCAANPTGWPRTPRCAGATIDASSASSARVTVS